MIVDYVDEVMNIPLWIINMFPDLTETFSLAFSLKLFKRALKLSMIMTFLWGWRFIPGSMALTLFQGTGVSES